MSGKTFNPDRYPYQVVQPIMSGGPEYYSSATPISQHLTSQEAWNHIDEAIAQIKKQPGQQNCYLNWTVIDARTLEPVSRYQDEDFGPVIWEDD